MGEDKPDQPAAGDEGAKRRDPAAALFELLSTPVDLGPAAETKPAVESRPAETPPAEGAPPSTVAASEATPSGAEDTPAAAKSSAAEPAPLDPAAARVIGKVRRLMVVSTLFTALAVTAVLGVIGYRVFRNEGSAPTQATLTLPSGARIVHTAVADDRIVLTLELNGATEIRTYDLKTLKPLGRLNFNNVR
jgi:hypothetical protein